MSVQTPKSILKRKCEKQGLSTTKKKGKKIRLSLTKTRNRKSLLNAFTESRSENDKSCNVDADLENASVIGSDNKSCKNDDCNSAKGLVLFQLFNQMVWIIKGEFQICPRMDLDNIWYVEYLRYINYKNEIILFLKRC